MISTRDLSELPEPGALLQLTKSLAMLDAVVEREFEYRYYSFNSEWSESEEMASMRNGQGDAWFCVFSSAGVFLKGFNHECQMSPWNRNPPAVWPGVLEEVPVVFSAFLSEPAFSISETTFCIWRAAQDRQWRAGNVSFPAGDDPDGSVEMLAILDGEPRTYQKWAEDYYQRPLSASAIHQIYGGAPLTAELAYELNPEVQFLSLFGDAAEIGYPIGPKGA
jgi:hypothetical protein